MKTHFRLRAGRPVSQILGLSLLVLGLCSWNGGTASADTAPLFVAAREGTATLIRDGRSRPLEEGMTLRRGDILQTDAGAKVDIVWKDHYGFRLLDESRGRLEETDTQDGLVDMTEGNIIVNVVKLPKRAQLRISTPTSVAAVRGTQFWGRVKPQAGIQKVTFAVRKGGLNVLVKAVRKTFKVGGKKALDIDEGQKDFHVRKATKEEMKMMSQADDIPVSDRGASSGWGSRFGDDGGGGPGPGRDRDLGRDTETLREGKVLNSSDSNENPYP